MTTHGSINHIALTVSNLEEAMQFFRPYLRFFGYGIGEPLQHAGTRLTINVHEESGTAINVWEAKRQHPFDVYEPGLHHLALNAASKGQVDEAHRLAKDLGAEILEGPAEFPFDERGYYALYFLGPDRIKFEVVHMPGGALRA